MNAGPQEIEDLKDHVMLVKAYNAEAGVAAHVVHQYAARCVRGAVVKFLVGKYAEQVVEGESAEQFGKAAEAKERAVEARTLDVVGVPHFDVEVN